MRSTLTIALLLSSVLLMSQGLSDFNQERLNITKNGMLVLGSWAFLNLSLNPVLGRRATGTRKYFHQMNTYWNVVNLGLAGVGYVSAMKPAPSDFSLSQSMLAQSKIEQILLFNAGLDVAYIVGGLYLWERSKNAANKPARLKGFGQSLMVQGGFLLAFDLVFYLVHHDHSSALYRILSSFTFTSNSVGLVIGL